MGSTQSTWGLPSVTATMVGLLGLSLVFFSALVAVVSYEYSAEECRSLGFNRANLLCSSCNYLEEFDLSALENECRACCQQEGKSDAAVLYPQAILDDDGVVKEELAIDKWNTDSVEEFLTMHLIMDQMSTCKPMFLYFPHNQSCAVYL